MFNQTQTRVCSLNPKLRFKKRSLRWQLYILEVNNVLMKLNRKYILCQMFELMNEAKAAQQTNADSNDDNKLRQ